MHETMTCGVSTNWLSWRGGRKKELEVRSPNAEPTTSPRAHSPNIQFLRFCISSLVSIPQNKTHKRMTESRMESHVSFMYLGALTSPLSVTFTPRNLLLLLPLKSNLPLRPRPASGACG